MTLIFDDQAWTFPIYVNFFQSDRADVHRATAIGIDVPSEKELELERNASHVEGSTEIVESK
jgi:hypothetical protein